MRPLLCAVFAAALTFGASAPTRSQTSSDPLTADAAVREALTANRDLRAARTAIDIARGGLLQAGRLENPELALGYADDFAFNAEGERIATVGFAQSFPVAARLAREKDVAGKDVAVAEAEEAKIEKEERGERECRPVLMHTATPLDKKGGG